MAGEVTLGAPDSRRGPEDWQRALERAIEQTNGRAASDEAEIHDLQAAHERELWSLLVRFSLAWEAAGMPGGRTSGGERPRGRRRWFAHRDHQPTTMVVIEGFGTATHRAEGGRIQIPRYLVLREGRAPIFTYAPHYAGDHHAHLMLRSDQGLTEVARQMTAEQAMDALATWCVLNGATVELPAEVPAAPPGTLEA